VRPPKISNLLMPLAGAPCQHVPFRETCRGVDCWQMDDPLDPQDVG